MEAPASSRLGSKGFLLGNMEHSRPRSLNLEYSLFLVVVCPIILIQIVHRFLSRRNEIITVDNFVFNVEVHEENNNM